MTFDQARELSFLVPWKTMECFSGPDCWCRIIVPVEPILYSHPENPDNKHEYVIVDAGALDEETAEYMVKLHNEHHEKVKQSCRDAIKEMTETLVPLDIQKLWNTREVLKRKEID